MTLALTPSRLAVLARIADYRPGKGGTANPWAVHSVTGYRRRSVDGSLNAFRKDVTRECEAMAAAGWIVEGDVLRPDARYPVRPWLITDAGKAALAASVGAEIKRPKPRLTPAQALRIEWAHATGGTILICDQSWAGDLDNRNSVHALVRAGLMTKGGLHPDDQTLTQFSLTNDGRRAYATSGQVIRHDRQRCNNPTCCGVWPEDPGQPPTHGSCTHCGRWVKCSKDGRINRHNIQPGHPCPGVGQLYEGRAEDRKV